MSPFNEAASRPTLDSWCFRIVCDLLQTRDDWEQYHAITAALRSPGRDGQNGRSARFGSNLHASEVRDA